jgi:hypothetical protein
MYVQGGGSVCRSPIYNLSTDYEPARGNPGKSTREGVAHRTAELALENLLQAVSSGQPHSDKTEAIRQASGRYRKSLSAHTQAVRILTEFALRKTGP